MGADQPQGAPSQIQGAVAALSKNLASQEFQKRNETNEIYIPPGERLGDLVIECKNVRKGYGDRLLIDSLSFNLPPGGIVGIIGPNGAGKTTLFRMLSGIEKPDSRRNSPGTQRQTRLCRPIPPSFERQEHGLAGNLRRPRSHQGRQLRDFFARLCRPLQFQRASSKARCIGELSGGERNRVHLAKVLKAGGNVLLLDEPTNDLDIETLRALEDALGRVPRLCRGHFA